MQQLKPITLKLSAHKVYKVASIIDRITDTDTPFLNLRKTNELFKELSEDIYFPLFKFIELHRLEVNLIITGEFIEKLEKYSPRSLNYLQKLVQRGLVTLVLDAYYGNSLSSLYNMAWWARSIAKTNDKVNKILGCNVEFVFLPQLFRALELERITQSLGITKFLLRSKGKNIDFYKSKLSELRRFDGTNPKWLEGDMDADLEFYFVPDKYYLIPNEIVFEKDRETAMKVFCMETGLKYNKFFLRPRVQEKSSKSLRISEKFSLKLYSQLQRSIIRLWDYASFIIASEEHVENQEYTRIKTISRNFASLQDPFFLLYLLPKFYNVNHLEITNFTSPYEAYVSMQSCVKHLEILLKNKI